ncbi:MAG: CDP-glycerol glycerophosphotransferase family protein [Turicibacter sanguinis]|uniref:CDP-glycerol glycerophosphotransferase family protein n=1 Tax=Turicibacter sanguinis TaxID=154288 RepID=UPI002F94902B
MEIIKKRFHQFCVLIKYLYSKLISKFIHEEKYNELWIITERGTDARDNGFCFYRYIKDNYPNINVMYVINRESSDFKKFNSNDYLIEYGSIQHYIAILKAKYLISTHVMGFTPEINFFMKLDKLKILSLNGKKVFLQHGITKDKANFDYTIDLIISGAKPEFEYLKTLYPKKNIQYTGFSRFDNLKSYDGNYILVMPTWRLYLNSEKAFLNSNYLRTYQSLVSNKKLNDILLEKNLKLLFYPHHEIQKYISNFKTHLSNIEICDTKKYDVAKLLMHTKLLITDYSSVYFDVAYIEKPVIYYHFDIKEYRSKHYQEGYFDYKRDGFGPIVESEELLIEMIQKYIQNNFKVENEYLRRTNCFFELRDKNNNKRILDEIEKL